MNADRRPHDFRARRPARAVPFFDGLTREALSLIAQVTTEESHALGTRIFQYGDPGDKLFIILEGKVRISREVAGMGEEALAVLGPGQVFGEMALLDESPRSADARAHERCRLLVITKDCLRRPPLSAQGPRVRGPLELRARPVGTPPRDERQAHVPLDEREVLTPRRPAKFLPAFLTKVTRVQ